MPHKQELEGMDLIRLAVLCGEVANNAAIDAPTVGKARELVREWTTLVARETPSPVQLTVFKQIQAEKAELKTRMVQFLATI